MAAPARTSPYFRAGGTLHLDDPSYVKRPADDHLFEQVNAGHLCYVLTTRQMGKSSLMIRTAARLQAVGVHTAIVDLSSLGARVTANEWYLGILTMLADDLDLGLDVKAWWEEHGARGVVQRFIDFLADEALGRCEGRVVVFIDEIDSTLSLDFTDDFFAAIRSMVNERVITPQYDRLTFVLLGVASPTSLIKDRSRTPFNIGHAVDLKEFSREDAQPLEAGLARCYPGAEGMLLDRIFYWTGGHPYLTQKLCSALARAAQEQPPANPAEPAMVDAWVERLFLARDARGEENLQFVRSRVQANPHRQALLNLYKRIYRSERVGEDDRSPLQNELKLVGLAAARDGALHVRNEIYRRVFDLRWIKESTPRNWATTVTIGAIVVIFLAAGAAILGQRISRDRAVRDATDLFHDSATAEARVVSLANLCTLRQETAQAVFFALPAFEQRNLFGALRVAAVQRQLPAVVRCLQPALAKLPGDEGAALDGAMCGALARLCAEEGRADDATCGCTQEDGDP